MRLVSVRNESYQKNYVYYMHFLVLNGSQQKCVRGNVKKRLFYFKSFLTSLIALEQLSWYSWKRCALKIHLHSRKCPRMHAIWENIVEYLIAKFGICQNKVAWDTLNYSKIGTRNSFPWSKYTFEPSDWRASTQHLHVVCRFLGYRPWKIHFWGQHTYLSIHTGTL